MKINWGTGIVIAFVVFIGFIMFLIVLMMTDKKLNHDLVTEEYYEEELAYQEEIDAETNSQLLSENIVITKTINGYLIVFPKNLDYSKIEGKVSLYRPSNKNLDFDLPLIFSDNKLLIPDNRLIEGRWDISVIWEYEGVKYLYKDKVMY